MYDIELIGNVFEEIEIMSVNPAFLQDFKPLINDNVGSEIYKAIKIFEESGIRQHGNAISNRLSQSFDMIEEILGDKVKEATLHLEAADRGLFEYLTGFSILAPFNHITDRAKLKSDIDWVLDNKKYWVTELQPRTSKEYKSFLEQCAVLQVTADSLYAQYKAIVGDKFDFGHNTKIVEIVEKNRGFFFSNGEKARQTGMSRIIARFADLQEVSKGVEWITYCAENKISTAQRRVLNF